MTLAPSWEQIQDSRRRASLHEARDAFLARLGDHLEAPSEQTWQGLLAAAEAVDGSGEAWGRPLAPRAGDIAEGLLSGGHDAWTSLIFEVLDWGDGFLAEGAGARLKALSPFAGKALVTFTNRPGGEINALFEAYLGRKGIAHAPGQARLLVLDPEAFDLGANAKILSKA